MTINPEKAREYYKKWRENNPEKTKQYIKEWNYKNREYKKKWREDNAEHVSASYKTWASKNKDVKAKHHIKRRYGLTVDDYLKMFEDQEGKCLCCDIHLYDDHLIDNKEHLKERGVPHRKINVDHDHSYNLPGELFSGKKESVRGMLCNDCNINYDPLDTKSDWYIYCEKEGKKRKEIITQIRKMRDGSNLN